jgi:flagellar FliL protein
MRKLLPVLLAIFGLGGGVGAGLFLRPSADAGGHAETTTEEGHAAEDGQGEAADHATEEPGANESADPAEEGGDGHGEGGPEYVKMNNQFVVPVVEDGRVDAMVVLAISLEVEAGNTEIVYQREPKLRDAFLQVMFDHANVGGFSGTFTDGSNLIVLRTNLKEAAAMILGTVVHDVLITDIARQDS